MGIAVELPEELFDQIKERAEREGLPLQALVVRLLEQGLHRQPGSIAEAKGEGGAARREALPVMVPPAGRQMRAMTNRELAVLFDVEDVERLHR